MPKTGPSDASRRQSTGERPMWPSPCVSETAVVVLPSPAFVGVIAVTLTSFASWAISSEDGMCVATVSAPDRRRGYGKYICVQSLADKAYHEIRGLIVSLELAPGAVIDERDLIERLGIGRTPVREALRRLALERLVEVYPRRGMFVTGVDVRQLARLSEVRAVLEPEAARLAAGRATDADREELDALLEELDAGGAELMELDERIHRAVYRAAHNDLLEATLE